MVTHIRGQVERITYFSEENNYTIARLHMHGNKKLVTVVGNLVGVNPGEVLEMLGEWVHHPRYGEQFKILQYRSILPASVYGIQKYLGSGLIKGIGPVMAKRLVAKFGKDTLHIIEDDVERLSEVFGIGQKRITMIKEAWEDQKEIHEVMIFLQSHGVSSGYATKIFKHYGKESITIVKDNPYTLATDIYGIGFLTADKIAEKMGIPKDAVIRCEAGILYVLNTLSEEGHVYYPYDSLIRKCEKILGVESEIVADAITNIVGKGHVVVDEDIENNEVGGKAVYLAGYYFSEVSLANRLRTLIDMPKNVRVINSERTLSQLQRGLHITLAEKQIEAIKTAIQDKVVVITGGPGTGKTTIINCIIKIYRERESKVVLAAPTGRAAKRMNELTGFEAKTIHRLLEYSLQKGGFRKDDTQPLDADVIIIDEASMIDMLLLYYLLKAVPPFATLVLVGDVNQLPSVGAGNVLKDIIDSGVVPVVELTEIFRQAQESLIIVNAHRIHKGKFPILKDQQKNGLTDFYFIEQEDPEKVLKLILTLVKQRIPLTFGFDPVTDIQVLSPMHRGVIGAENLNQELQSVINPASSPEITRGGKKFRVDDKVMQIRNDYDKEVFNGDIGRIISIDQETQEVIIQFDEKQVPYSYSDLDAIVLAYAVSVHKSQGSEFPVVIIPLMTQHYMLLQRNLLYTGVTRGEKLVILIGTKKALAIAIKNNQTLKRYTLLKERLISHKK